MFCANCGKELAEGEVCTCTQENTVPQTEEVQQEYYNPENINPSYYVGTYYDPSSALNAKQEQEEIKKLPARTDYPEGYKIKKKYVAVLLAFSLGTFGIHNFYLGKSEKAIAQVILSTVGALLTFGISAIAVTIWATVEGVLLLTEDKDKDANGYKIQTFEESLAKQMNKD